MMYHKKPITVDATQWFRNGDHPLDYAKDAMGFENGELWVFTGAERKANDWEGGVVRYFRTPGSSGTPCPQCGIDLHQHGWLDAPSDGHRVCPSDWIITGIAGEMRRCKDAIFRATYEAVEVTA